MASTGAASGLTSEPRRRLAKRARSLWRLSAALFALPLLAGAFALTGALEGLGTYVRLLPLLLATLAIAAMVGVVPELRWRRWRYEIRDHEIDIRHGALLVRRTLVPVSRVQHVETRRGPLQASFELTTVVFHTAAGETTVPQLTDQEAASVRDRVAALTRAPDDV